MPFNGAGVYSPPGANFPAVANTLILSNDYNTVVNDIATALSNCMTKDGQTVLTANIPMAGFRFTGLGAGAAVGDSATIGQAETFTNKTLTAPTISNPSVTGTLTAAGLVDLSGAAAGQIKFPAAQNASANANTLDDYEEGTWTPVLTTSGSVGDLVIAYSSQVGRYVKIGKKVIAVFNIVTSTFTWSTTGAAGVWTLTGLPYASANVTGKFEYGPLGWQGVTKASYTQCSCYVGVNVSAVNLEAYGSGQSASLLTVANTPSGGTVVFSGQAIYEAAN
jgi:hypothetical protein